MPAEVIRDPLSLKVSLPGQEPTLVKIGEVANPLLAADLAEGLAATVHPNGPIAKLTTLKAFVVTLRRMVRELAADGFTGSAAELSRPLLGELWLRSQYLVEYRTRTIVRSFDQRHHALSEPVRQMVFGTNYTRPLWNGPLKPYQPDEWNRLIDLCKAEVRQLGEMHRAMVALAEGGQDPVVGGWSEANAAWLLLRTGPVSRVPVAEHLGMTLNTFKHRCGSITKVRETLFPTHLQAVPYVLLMSAWSGIVPDGLAGLAMNDVRWTGKQAMLLSYTKGRTSQESMVLPARASGLLQQWLGQTEVMPKRAPDERAGHVWLVLDRDLVPHAGTFREYLLRNWVKQHGLRADSGEPFPVDRRWLRTTFIAQRGQREWSLRATIDPNHSPQVEGDPTCRRRRPPSRR